MAFSPIDLDVAKKQRDLQLTQSAKEHALLGRVSVDTPAEQSLVDRLKFPEIDTTYLHPEQQAEYEQLRQTYNENYNAALEAYARLDPNYKTNPNAILNDRQVRTTLGGIVDAAGGFISSVGGMINTTISAPASLNKSLNITETVGDLAETGLNKAAELLNIRGGNEEFGKVAREVFGDEAVDRISSVLDAAKPTNVVANLAKGADAAGDVLELGLSVYSNPARERTQQVLAQYEWENADSVRDLLGGVYNISAENPGATFKIAVQSIPHMVALARGGNTQAAVALGMVTERADESIELFEKEHGRKPKGKELGAIYSAAVAATAIEVVESRFILKGTPINPAKLKTMTGAISKIPGLGATARIGAAAGAELFQEGSAAYLTQVAGRQTIEGLTSDETLGSTYIQGSIGAGAGGATRGSIELVTVPGAIADAAAKNKAEKLGKDLPTIKAINDSLDQQHAAVDQVITSEADTDVEFLTKTVPEAQKALAEVEKQINQLKKNPSANKEVAQLEALAGNLIQKISGEINAVKERKQGAAAKNVIEAAKQVEQAQTTQDAAQVINKVSDQIVDAYGSDADAVINFAKSEKYQTAKEEGLLSAETVERVDRLLNAHESLDNLNSFIRERINTPKDGNKDISAVESDVLNGGKGFVGINEYNKIFNGALISNTKDAAVGVFKRVANFAQNQRQKYNRLEEDLARNPRAHAPEFVEQILLEAQVLEAARDHMELRLAENFGDTVVPSVTKVEQTVDQSIDPEEITPPPLGEATPQEALAKEAIETAEKETTKESVETVAESQIESKPKSVDKQSALDQPSVETVTEPSKETTSASVEESAKPQSERSKKKAFDLAIQLINETEISLPALKSKLKVAKSRIERSFKERNVAPDLDIVNQFLEDLILEQDQILNSDAHFDNLALTLLENSINKDSFKAIFKARKRTINSGALVKYVNLFERIENRENDVPIQQFLQQLTKDEKLALKEILDIYKSTQEILNSNYTPKGAKFTVPHLLKFIGVHNNSVTNNRQPPAWASAENALNGGSVKGGGKDPGDPLYYLVTELTDGTWELDPNIVGAIATSLYEWMGNRAGAYVTTDANQVRKFLGLDDNAPLPPGSEFLFDVGAFRDTIEQELGATIYNQLGLKFTAGDVQNNNHPADQEPTADGDLSSSIDQGTDQKVSLESNITEPVNGAEVDRLKLSLGQLAVTILMQQGLVEETQIEASRVDQLQEKDIVRPEGTMMTFLRPARIKNEDGTYELSTSITEQTKALQAGKSLLANHFDTQIEVVEPSNEPIKEVSDTLKRSRQKVTRETKKTVEKMQSVPWLPKTKMVDMLEFLGRKTMERIVGIEEDYEKTTLPNNLANKKGQQDGLKRELKNAFRFFQNRKDEGTYESPFYFKYEVWQVGRIGLRSQSLNPQTSKIHRFLTMPAVNEDATDNELEVNPGTPGNRPMSFGLYAIGVAQAFGFDIDKNRVEDAFHEFFRIQEQYKDVVEAIREIRSNPDLDPKVAEEYRELIVQALEGAGEPLHRLDGLNALADFTEGKPFKTSLMIEVDGVTNGVAIGLMQSGLGDLKDLRQRLAATGIFTDGVSESYHEFKESGGLDTYEALGQVWKNYVDESLESQSERVRMAWNTIVGDFTNKRARKLSKSPTMTTQYGAGSASVIREFIALIEGEVYERIEEFLKNPTKENQAKADELFRALAVVTNGQIRVNIRGRKFQNNPELIEQLRTNPLPMGEFRQQLKKVYGKPLGNALDNHFASFFQYKDFLNNSIQYVFAAFQIAYNRKVNELIQKNGGKPLSKAQKEEILNNMEDQLPIIKGPYSESLSDGLLIINSENESTTDPQFAVQQNYGGVLNNGNAARTGQVQQKVFTNPGVKGGPFAVQNVDSAIIQKPLQALNMLNVHDAGGFSLADALQGTVMLNESFFERMRDYSIAQEFFDTFTRAMTLAEQQGISLDQIQEQYLANLPRGQNLEGKALEFQSNVGGGFARTLAQIEAGRNSIFEQLNAVNQYALQYGQHTVTDESFDIDQFQLRQNIRDIVLELQGSEDIDIDPTNFESTVASDPYVTSETVGRIFNLLGTLGPKRESSEHTGHLENLLNQIISKGLVHLDNLEIKIREKGNRTYGQYYTKQDGTTGEISRHVNLNASRSDVAIGTDMSTQEAYVHELLHAVLQFGVNENRAARRELLKLFKLAEREITPDDFRPRDADGNIVVVVDEAAEIAAAEKRYDYIFNNTDSSGTNYLHEFAAIALSNEYFQKRLEGIEVKSKKIEYHNLKQWLTDIFLKIMDMISDRIFKTEGATLDVALHNWAARTATINQVQQNEISKWTAWAKGANTKAAEKIQDWLVEPISKFKVPGLTQNKYIGLVRKLGVIYFTDTQRTEQLERLEQEIVTETNPQKREALERSKRRLEAFSPYSKFHAGLDKVFSREKQFRESWLTSLVNEVAGADITTEDYYRLHRESKHIIDQTRKRLATHTIQFIEDGFERTPSDEEQTVLLQTLIKTDLVTLLDGIPSSETHSAMDLPDLINLLENPAEVTKLIKILEADLRRQYKGNGNYYVRQARSLGHQMVTGVPLERDPMQNAYNIAQMLGNVQNATGARPRGNLQYAEKLIDRLATFQALAFTSQDAKAKTLEILKAENTRNAGDNGILRILSNHHNFKRSSLHRNFNQNKIQTIKGYTAEIFDPSIDVKLAPASDHVVLTQMGYKRHGEALPTDPAAPHKEKMYMYVAKHGIINAYQKETVSLTNTIARGTTLEDLYFKDPNQQFSQRDALNQIQSNKVYQAEIKNQFRQQQGQNKNTPIMIPILDEKGRIVNYRYVMSEHNKRELLNKDERVAFVLGRMQGSIEDKVNSKLINRKVIDLLDQEYREDMAAGIFNDERYIRISPLSQDEDLQELYSLLPDDMKKYAEDHFDGKAIYVRKELMNLVFGYRKATLANFPGIKNFTASKVLVKQVEDALAWVVKQAKLNIVIKSPQVLKDNILSNMVLLFTKGVPMSYLLKEKANGAIALTKYLDEQKELDLINIELESDLNLSPSKKRRLEVKKTQLETELKRNPIAPLVDEGLFQSIIEDVELERSPYTYRSRLEEKMGTILKNVPDVATQAGKQLYMTEDTTTFKLMMKTTQYSDFVARYALWKYRTQVEKVPHQAAITEAVDTFVNYDVPTGKYLQYLNDMGIFMFTKFLFRIQRIILQTLRNQPATTLSILLAQQATGDFADIADSNLLSGSALSRVHTPFVDSIDSAATFPLLDMFTS